MDPKIKGLKEGDKEVIRELYLSQMKKVVHWVQRTGGRTEDGQDIFQDALEAIIIRVNKGPLPDNIVLEAYLMQIAKNKWIDQIRRKKLLDKVRLVEEERHISDKHIEEGMILAEEEQAKHHMMKATLSKLSPLCQQLLRMILSEKKTAEIIETLGFTNANTMYRRKFACMKSWKSFLIKYRDRV